MSSQHDGTPAEGIPVSDEIGPVTVRRAPRYYRFMAVGAAVGVILTIIVTFAFPEQPDFSRIQVLGFTGLFVVAIFVALGALVAILLDRVSRRRARTVTVERIEERDAENGDPEVGA